MSGTSITESPLHSIAQYIEDYMDLVENVPNDIARQITQLHEHNHRYHQLLEQLESTLDVACGKTSANELKKRNAMLKIQRYLVEIQEIADEKLVLIQAILDQLDGKARQLDYDYRAVTMSSASSNALSSRISLMSGNLPASVNVGSHHQTHGHARDHGAVITSAKNEVANNVNVTNNASNNEESTTSTVTGKDTCFSNSNGGQTSSSLTGNSASATAGITPSSVSSSSSSAHKRASARRQSTKNDLEGSGKKGMKKMKGGAHALKGGKELKGKNKTNTSSSGGNATSSGTGGVLDSPPRPIFDQPIDPDEPTYCLCDQVSFGEMICCDNNTCKIEWFHFSCVSLNAKPKGKWYCPGCRGERSNIMKK